MNEEKKSIIKQETFDIFEDIMSKITFSFLKYS